MPAVVSTPDRHLGRPTHHDACWWSAGSGRHQYKVRASPAVRRGCGCGREYGRRQGWPTARWRTDSAGSEPRPPLAERTSAVHPHESASVFTFGALAGTLRAR